MFSPASHPTLVAPDSSLGGTRDFDSVLPAAGESLAAAPDRRGGMADLGLSVPVAPVVSRRHGDVSGGQAPSPGAAVALDTTVAPVPTTLPAGILCDEPAVQERQLTEANRRLGLVQAVEAHWRRAAAAGLPRPGWETVAPMIGESASTIRRFVQGYQRAGYAGLVPQWHQAGRRPTTERLATELGADVWAECVREMQGNAKDTHSVTSGIRFSVNTSLETRLRDKFGAERAARAADEMQKLIATTDRGTPRRSKHSLPPSIRDEVAKATDKNQKLAHRGPRALNIKGFSPKREVDVLPGDVFSSDDTTPIWGWWVAVPWAKNNSLFERDSSEYRFGEMLLQGQYLPLIDVASQAVLDITLIARATAGYRAADIWGMLGHTFDTHGLPRLGLQFERGSWEAKLIEGEQLEWQDGEVTINRRVGGLRMLPTLVTDWHRQKYGAEWAFPPTLQTFKSYSPNSKPVENVIHRLQVFEGTIWGSLGRSQMLAPYERMKLQFQRCQRGAERPSEHFLSGSEIMERLVKLCRFYNSEPIEGRVFSGVPAEKWAAAVREYPLLGLPAEQRHLYQRDWTTATVRRGMVRIPGVTASGDKTGYFYCEPRTFARPGMEERTVLVYHDKSTPENPVQIHDARSGEYLCDAAHVQPAGMFLSESSENLDLKKLWRDTVTTFHASIIPHAPSRQLPPEISARRAPAPAPSAPMPTAAPVPTPAPRSAAGPDSATPRTSAWRRALGGD